MKAFVSHTLSGIDSLVMEELPAPDRLGSGQIRVALRAASLNFRDLLVLSGALRSVTLGELIPCSDGAGEVIEAAPDVGRVKVGDRVALTFNPDWIGGPWEPSVGGGGRGVRSRE
jgi:NADPH:quinone reductase-like Zn-dependent oxidoreductase